MEKNRRTVNCGQLTIGDVGKTVTLNGWIHRNRDHGGVHFINLRDRYGITQVVIDEEASEDLRNTASELKMEFCVAAVGTVRARPEGMVNEDMATGEVELAVSELEVLNSCLPLPFMVDSEEEPNENLRLKYRYLHLRTQGMQDRIKMRHDATWAVRNYLTDKGFWEVETPTLIKSTPEGARDYLVPSRVNPGRFYALPQSPQLYKQILMAGGTDRYYQIARCYRDEDARGDRQPEFTQIDLEMSFASRDDVLETVEGMMVKTFKDVLDVDVPTPFPRLSWQEAMENYGSDKPDLRFNMKFQDFAPFVSGSEFGVFKSVLESGGTVKAMVVPAAAEVYSRKKISELEDVAKSRGARGLAWMKVTAEGLDGGVSKFYTEQAAAIKNNLDAKEGDLILLMGSDWKTAVTSLGAVRVKLGADLGLTKPEEFKFCWVIDFPLFEKNEETGNWEPAHHMFSMPQERFLDTMEENPGEVLGDLYDMVLNGNELASGSVRIHDPAIQSRVFDIVGFPKKEAEERFGFLLEAFRYGAPPHAGLAVGFDRMVMVMAQMNTIRDVIAFPKNTQGISPMDNSPSPVDADQLADLKLAIIEEKQEDKA
ncbi:MAG: aspartate--tRNA ligase [Spirochaetes bacterium]|nr:MAG: aspartate--tRNA ligase [Spirochaetota bacterium]